MLSRYFLNYLLNKIINCTKLLLFDIYLTYNLQVIWTPYSKERLVVAPAICTGMMDIWTSMVPLICFEMVELHCLDRVTQQLGCIHHITVDINTSDVLHVITCRGKNNDYDLLGRHRAYISQWEAWKNDIFTEMHHVITNEMYMVLYMSITRQIITPDPEQHPPPGYM
jgi:hypothetical protein